MRIPEQIEAGGWLAAAVRDFPLLAAILAGGWLAAATAPAVMGATVPVAAARNLPPGVGVGGVVVTLAEDWLAAAAAASQVLAESAAAAAS